MEGNGRLPGYISAREPLTPKKGADGLYMRPGVQRPLLLGGADVIIHPISER